MSGAREGHRARLRRLVRPKDLARSLAVGALAGGIGLAVRGLIALRVSGDIGYVPYAFVIMLAAWYGGIPAGILATLISALGNVWLYAFPGSLVPEPLSEQVRLILYISVGALIAGVIPSLRSQRDELSAALAEQARLGDEILERDERLATVLWASSTAVWEADPDGSHPYLSEHVLTQLGLDAGDPRGDVNVLDLLHPDDRDRARAAIRDAIAADAPFDLDVRLLSSREGEPTVVRLRGRAFRESGGHVRVLGTSEDVTERTRLARERAALVAEEERTREFREAFIDVLSHELRTPMTTILGAAELLTRPTSRLPESERAELLHDVHEETARLDGLIENLLFLSRSERGTLASIGEPVQVRRLVERAIALEAERWPSLRFSADISDGLPVAMGEDAYVTRVLANLLSNAGKYSRPGGRVVVEAHGEGPEVVVRVLDEGVGIDVDPGQLFTLFYRAPAAARHASGSGVGLFVCAQLVDTMGGRIWARSRETGGAEFGFALRRYEELPPATPGH